MCYVLQVTGTYSGEDEIEPVISTLESQNIA